LTHHEDAAEFAALTYCDKYQTIIKNVRIDEIMNTQQLEIET